MAAVTLVRRPKVTCIACCFWSTWLIVTAVCYVFLWWWLDAEPAGGIGAGQRQMFLPVDPRDAPHRRPVNADDSQWPSLPPPSVHHHSPSSSVNVVHHRSSAGRMSLDYCNALPPRSSDDVVTDEGRFADGLRLVGVLMVVRHGHRAPMYSLPNHRSVALSCNLSNVPTTSSHDVLLDRSQAARLVAAMDDILSRGPATNPSWRRYGLYPATRTCSAAQLTAYGALQMVRVGLLFGHVAGYSDLLATSKVTVRSSDYSRAVHSAAALLYGLGGETTRLVDEAKVELARDAYLCLEQPGRRSSTWLMNVTCGCRAALNTLALRRRHNRTRDAEDRLLRTELADVLNTTAERLPWSAAILEVSLSQLCVAGTLPCDLTNQRCLQSTHLDRMWRVVHQDGRRDVTDDQVSRATILLVYPLLVDIVVRLVDMAAADHRQTAGSSTQQVPEWLAGGRSSRRSEESSIHAMSRLVIYSGHDKTLTALLTALRLHDGRWPVLAARLVAELVTAGSVGQYYFRLLYDGRDVTSRLEFCVRALRRGACPLDNFVYAVIYHISRRFDHASQALACAVR